MQQYKQQIGIRWRSGGHGYSFPDKCYHVMLSSCSLLGVVFLVSSQVLGCCCSITILRGGARASRARLPPGIIVSIMRSALTQHCDTPSPSSLATADTLRSCQSAPERHLNNCLTVTDISSHHTLTPATTCSLMFDLYLKPRQK